MEKKKYFLDIAHMHPVCPLSLSHARIFALADVWARWKRRQGFFVRFPICMHYSGSTVFKITKAVSNFLKKQNLSDTDQKILDLIFNFYRIPKEHLHKLTDPVTVLDYFSNIILQDLKSIQISCDYDNYFNTENPFYKEFVRAVFDIYAEKRFIKIHNDNKGLDYPNPLFRSPAIKRLNETEFSPPTAKDMVAESLEKLDDEWQFERDNSIGTSIDKHVIDPMFDAEFISIFNAIYPYLKNLEISQSNARDIFKEFLYKIENPGKKVSGITDKLYSNLQEILPVNKFIAERHLQNWVAKRMYTEAILLPAHLSTREYFFIGSITKNGCIDSASRGIGITLHHLLEEADSESVRVALLLSFTTPHRDYEWSSTLKHARKKLKQFNDFISHLKNSSIKDQCRLENVIKIKGKEMETDIVCGKIRKALLTIFDELPQIIQPLCRECREATTKNNQKNVLNFLIEYLNIFCPSLISKSHENRLFELYPLL